MGLLEAGSDVVAYEGELVGKACEDFTVALNLLRRSEAEAPVVDLTRVTYISRRGVGLLVALWSDLDGQARRIELLASDRVWEVLGRIGVAQVFSIRPDEAPRARAGCVGALHRSGATRREAH